MKNRIQVAFDLGSFSIKGAVGRIINENQIEILSIRSIRTDSMDNGDIVDKEALLRSLEYLIEKMEKDAKISMMHGFQYLEKISSLLIHQLELDQRIILNLKLMRPQNKSY